MPKKLIRLEGAAYLYDPDNPDWGFWVPDFETADKILELWNRE